MPRYYFHFLDESTATLVKDSAGTPLLNAGEAKREATGLARDILSHRLDRLTWQIVVADDGENVVARVPLSNIRPRRIRAVFDPVRRLLRYEPRLRPQIFTWLLMAAVLALVIQAMMLSDLSRQQATDITGSSRSLPNLLSGN